ncbi:DUF4214 domain-containing protein [Pseudomaricurvus alkylphenolicus]|uniref:DUF4214 domain-containing protein n=1 Tax=Pseudomaricurvus alkylphenolicus TaxID=1306991 RepID=UPI001422A931|nr:DUF4214 domain-containing protein [Pseudomaricurvus alkylphenolicus]NIB44364.1 DUF4214 domain-containing protein [Pseudomaricurvus alkylphenolicus]
MSSSDVTAPVLSAFTLTDLVDVSSGSAPLEFHMEASDDDTGIDSATIFFDSELTYSFRADSPTANGTWDLVVLSGFYDSWDDGIAEESKWLFNTNSSGTHTVTGINIRDLAGNVRTYTTEDLNNAGFDTSFELIGAAPDTQAPELSLFSLTPSVDASSGSGPLTFSLEAADDESGVKSATVHFDSDLTYSHRADSATANGTWSLVVLNGFYDSWDDGVSVESKGIFDTNSPGIYTVTKLDIEDVAGNVRTYTTEELISAGFSTSFELTGATADTEAPEITAFSLSPTVDTTSGSGPLNFQVEASDDISDIDQVTIYFDSDLTYSHRADSPTANGTWSLVVLSGFYDSWDDGISNESKGIFDNNVPGTYSVTKVSVNDTAGNVRTYTTSELASLGFDTSFRIIRDNSEPTGTLAITGTLTQGHTLSLSNTLNDADGMGDIEYQWYANNQVISGANSDQLVLVQDQVGKSITVKATYIDGQGEVESVTSAATSNVANVNDSPVGTVSFGGSLQEGRTLVAWHNLTDEDGLGSVRYQWYANGRSLSREDSSQLSLDQSLVGESISVRASYTDGYGRYESVYSAASAAVANVNDAPYGEVILAGVATEGHTLYARHTITDEDGMGTVRYQWYADYVAIGGATGSEFTLGQAQVGKVIRAMASYTDGQGTRETVFSDTTSAVTNVNNGPSGGLTISGIAREDETLTIVSTVSDEDGLGSFQYQWYASSNPIEGATGDELTLTQAEVGARIVVLATYVDGYGHNESVTSDVTPDVSNVNDDPVGDVTISGEAVEGETLTASHSLTDEDDLDDVFYQWYQDGVAIDGADDAQLLLTQDQVGKVISVRGSYTDRYGTAEQVFSGETAMVANVNNDPTGSLSITGVATEGETLTLSHDLGDIDGLGTVQYQWFADGIAIEAATDTELTLTQEQVGKQVTAEAFYSDAYGADERIFSAATSEVMNVNNAPTGTVTINGDAIEGQTLSISHDLADDDGLGTVRYQWYADGNPLDGQTSAAIELTQAHVGKPVFVVISYTDGYGQSEQVSSAETELVANVNNPPTGTVTITGNTLLGESLTGSHNLEDDDGLGEVVYQWYADDLMIHGANNNTLSLTQALLGKSISLEARYVDGYGEEESIRSDATSAVSHINNAPVGEVDILGTAEQGQTLTATNSLSDEDGLGTLHYQWLAEGAPIEGATTHEFTLTQAQVGKRISVAVSYTDSRDTEETVTSVETIEVANVNDAPSGAVSIAGEFRQGEVLTVSHTLSDTDGLGDVHYQWLVNGVEQSSDNSTQLLLTQAHVSQTVLVRASYQDGQGTLESVSSIESVTIENVNDAPLGQVSIAGTPTQENTLQASHNLTDADGLGTMRYQWYADGEPLPDEVSSELQLEQSHVGEQISVAASYTDGFENTEVVHSAETDAVSNINDAPEGGPTILGFPRQGGTLQLSESISDADGVGALLHQWFADGVELEGENGSQLALTQAHVSQSISVATSYVDGFGHSEQIVSSATNPVENVNDAPELAFELPDQHINRTDAFEFIVPEGSFVDIDGDELTYFGDLEGQNALPDWIEFDPVEKRFFVLEGQAETGVYSLQVTVQDPYAETAFGIFELTIINEATGRVADGYIAGAEIFIDVNSDGIADPEESTGVFTDADGNFSLQTTLSGDLLAVGGTNIDTGLPNDLLLSAPEHASIINPLTTLVQEVKNSGELSTEAAESAVQSALGIEEDIDLISYDPLAQDDELAIEVQSKAVQVAAVAALSPYSDEAVSQLADAIAQDTSAVDLTSEAFLSATLEDFEETDLERISTLNQQLSEAESLDDLAQWQKTAFDDTNDAPVVVAPYRDIVAVQGVLLYHELGDAQNTRGIIDLDADDSLTFSATLANGDPLPDWLTFDNGVLFGDTGQASPADQPLVVRIQAVDNAGLSAFDDINVTVVPAGQPLVNPEGDQVFYGNTGNEILRLDHLPSQYEVVDDLLVGVHGEDTLVGIASLGFGYAMGDAFSIELHPSSLSDHDGVEGPYRSYAATMLDQISDLYIAYFGRAPEAEGLSYWFKQIHTGALSLQQVAQSFSHQPEYRATYPEGASHEEFIRTIYHNLFSREPTTPG